MIDSSNYRGAYQSIRESILTLKYQPGHQIKKIPHAKTLKLNRTPIRKTVIRLVNEDPVVTYPNNGAFVTLLSKTEIDYMEQKGGKILEKVYCRKNTGQS